jgi:hypothetical protein
VRGIFLELAIKSESDIGFFPWYYTRVPYIIISIVLIVIIVIIVVVVVVVVVAIVKTCWTPSAPKQKSIS